MWEIPRIIGFSQMTLCCVQHGHSTVLKIDATARCCVCMCCDRAIDTFLRISHKPQRWCWNRIYHQKAHKSSFPTMHLRNGNVVKFSHTNRKHFTVGDPMAFPIVKMDNKPPNFPFPLHDVDPYLIQQCLGQPHAPPQTTAPTVEALSHTDAVKSPLVTMARPKFAPRVLLSMDGSPNPATCLMPGPLWSTMPNSIRIRSAIYPQCTGETDRPTDACTDRQTDRSSTGKFDDYRPLRSESDAA